MGGLRWQIAPLAAAHDSAPRAYALSANMRQQSPNHFMGFESCLNGHKHRGPYIQISKFLFCVWVARVFDSCQQCTPHASWMVHDCEGIPVYLMDRSEQGVLLTIGRW